MISMRIHMLKYLRILFALMCILNLPGFLLCGFAFSVPHQFKILEEDNSHIIVEYTVSEKDLRADSQKAPEYTGSGLPKRNISEFAHRTIIGIPEGAVVSLELIGVDWQDLPHETAQLLEAIFSFDKKKESGPAVNFTYGYLRDQKVAIVEVHPLKYKDNNSSLCLIAQRIICKLNFSAPDKLLKENKKTGAGIDSLFCPLLKNNILNYKSPQIQHTPSSARSSSLEKASLAAAESSTFAPIKITVNEKGMYKVAYADIQAAGWALDALDPAGCQLKNMGNNVPILFSGEEDHSFDTGDYFIFYGEPVKSDMTHNSDNKFTLPNVYWLYAFESNALRMKQSQSPNVQTPLLEDFKETVLEEHDVFGNESIDSFLWKKFPDYEDKEREDPMSENFSISLPGVNLNKQAMLRVKLKGQNNNPDFNPDHHAKIVVNNAFSYDAYFDSWIFAVFETIMPPLVLNDGSNIIAIKNSADLGAGEDLFSLDWFEIEYSRYFEAVNDELFFSIDKSGVHTVTINGFSNDAVMLFYITDALNVSQVTGYSTVQNGQKYSITFQTPADADNDSTYIALTLGTTKAPVAIEIFHAEDLKQTASQADYIIITHEDFYDEAQKLASYRESQGYKVKNVKVQDIYDEFNFGIMHPQAIKDFISYAYHSWSSPSPSFVLLVGDGNSDATDRLNTGNKNFIPVKLDLLGPTNIGPNDSWYGEVNGDDVLPDVILGRIPVKTREQLQIIIDRIILYEKASPVAWMRKALFVADDDPYFEAINEQLALNNLPFNYKADFFNRSDGGDGDIIIDKVNSGTAFTIYSGHGNITSWNVLLDTSMLVNLKSSNKPTFLMTLDCFNGDFSHPTDEGFSEEFLRASGGSLGCLTPGSTGYPYEHKAIAQNFLNELFNDNNTILGSAAYEAKLKAYADGIISEDTFRQYIYMGDPATHFYVCAFHLSAPADRASVSLNTVFTWEGEGFSKFIVQFSPTPDFDALQTIPVFTFRNQYSPTPLIWIMLNYMARQNNVVWWRVGGLESDITFSRDLVIDFQKTISYAEPKSFSIVQ